MIKTFDRPASPVENKHSMNHSILITDDDPHIRELLRFALTKAGMTVREAEDGEAALAMVAQDAPDLIILDINMPRMDGLEVCRRLRALGTLPILFLSSRDDEIDRVLGLELGGDDYVTKPFSPREVVARVNAILKRGAPSPLNDAATHNGVISIGMLRLDPEAWDAQWGTQAMTLTATEFELLKLLASSPSKVFSRDAMIDRLHGPGFAITDRTIDSHIRNLRAKFATVGAHDLIETRAGVGYRIGACLGASSGG